MKTSFILDVLNAGDGDLDKMFYCGGKTIKQTSDVLRTSTTQTHIHIFNLDVEQLLQNKTRRVLVRRTGGVPLCSGGSGLIAAVWFPEASPRSSDCPVDVFSHVTHVSTRTERRLVLQTKVPCSWFSCTASAGASRVGWPSGPSPGPPACTALCRVWSPVCNRRSES